MKAVAYLMGDTSRLVFGSVIWFQIKWCRRQYNSTLLPGEVFKLQIGGEHQIEHGK